MDNKKNYNKEIIRGTIKEIMKTRGLRSISVSNYKKWKYNTNKNEGWLHSIKINMEDGYMYMHTFGKSTQAGPRYDKPTMEQYNEAYNVVTEILANENEMPSGVKRNVLVKMAR